MAGGSLPIITYHHSVLPVDSPLVARFLSFASLADIVIDTGCSPRPCISKPTDQDVGRLAIALPNLEVLTLGGSPCDLETYPMTLMTGICTSGIAIETMADSYSPNLLFSHYWPGFSRGTQLNGLS